ncbi:hypothetical protein CsatB_021080 [Cannabis sativa]
MGCSSYSFSSSFSSLIRLASLPVPLLKLLLLLWVFSNGVVVVFAAAGSDKLVLLQLKNSVSDTAGLLSNWNSIGSDHCLWFGVSCDSNSRVVSLNITGTGSGTGGNSQPSSCFDFAKFPLYGFGIRRDCLGSRGKLVGKLSPVIGKLTELRILSLPFNDLNGEIPGAIWGMDKLEVLDLEGNSINGKLPIQFNKNLRVLNLGFNRIEGDIPSSLSNCKSLEILNLSGNRVNGTIPAFVGRLRGVYLSYNRLSGRIPSEIGENCGKLEHLDLSGNFLIDGIPSTLGNCGELRTLLLYTNMLLESIPAELGRLRKLQVLDVSRNSLSGAIPHQLENCMELSVLVLSNRFNPLSKINYTEDNSSLEQMYDDFNYFQGAIPEGITALPKLRIIWAPRATLEGGFPSNWGSCANLEMINLAQNFFTGEIPAVLGHCKKLHYLDISSNKLTGKFIGSLLVPCMTLFDISGNMLSGSIPAFHSSSCTPIPTLNELFFNLDNPSSPYQALFSSKAQDGNILQLYKEDGRHVIIHNFGQNNFTGILPSMPIAPERLGKQIVYAFLAGENKFTGAFPGSLFDKCEGLDALFVNISYNRLSGPIPAEIGKMCRSLQFLDTSGNQIAGPIPLSIGDLSSLLALNLSWNLLQDEIPVSLDQLKVMKYLSLAGNNLSGSIPSGFGQLQSLEVLDLSSNSLTGEIPRDLVNLKGLSVLLLDKNRLSGQIPSGLANVTTLSVFNVSFNNLSGSLPSNSNLMKCNSAIGNPFIRSCRMYTLTESSSNAQGRGGDSEPYAASPSGVPTHSSANGGLNSIEIASVASASAIVSVLISLIILFIYTRKWNSKSKVRGSTRKEVTVFTDFNVPLTFEAVVRATGNFNASNCIGNGGFGATYKAEIAPGVLVAIKRLAVGRFQGFQQFHAEIKTLGRLRHPNLVTLIGYHASETEMFLIYNYLPGGNLEKFIQERSTRAVEWRILYKIALDIARALAYLHDQCVPRVLHRDVKPSNILLDDEFNAYLSDFGLARLLGTSETHATTGVAGTFGYVAPEYAMTCRVSDKADVYSYGVVLLELLSDKKALDPSFSSFGNGFNIVQWACMLLRQGRAKEFFTAGLWDTGPHDDLVEVLHLAVVCTVDSLSTRPTTRQVVRRLKQLQPP